MRHRMETNSVTIITNVIVSQAVCGVCGFIVSARTFDAVTHAIEDHHAYEDEQIRGNSARPVDAGDLSIGTNPAIDRANHGT